MLSSLEQKLLVAWNLPGVGARTLEKVVRDPSFLDTDLRNYDRADKRIAEALRRPGALDQAETRAQAIISDAAGCGAHILSFVADAYPPLLKATPDFPPFLYVFGSVDVVRCTKAVAVIGTRSPTTHGTLIAQRIAAYLAVQGWNIVSGLALGCDTAAREGALSAQGRTTAVLAHGLHTVAPAQNRKLADRIVASGGALVTEYPVGVQASPRQFVKRDKIQAGLARGVALVQSGLHGGSLHACRATAKYGRILATAYPTRDDMKTQASKVQANLVLSDGDRAAKADLLAHRADSGPAVEVIWSREDYQVLEGLLDGWLIASA